MALLGVAGRGWAWLGVAWIHGLGWERQGKCSAGQGMTRLARDWRAGAGHGEDSTGANDDRQEQETDCGRKSKRRSGSTAGSAGRRPHATRVTVTRSSGPCRKRGASWSPRCTARTERPGGVGTPVRGADLRGSLRCWGVLCKDPATPGFTERGREAMTETPQIQNARRLIKDANTRLDEILKGEGLTKGCGRERRRRPERHISAARGGVRRTLTAETMTPLRPFQTRFVRAATRPGIDLAALSTPRASLVSG